MALHNQNITNIRTTGFPVHLGDNKQKEKFAFVLDYSDPRSSTTFRQYGSALFFANYSIINSLRTFCLALVYTFIMLLISHLIYHATVNKFWQSSPLYTPFRPQVIQSHENAPKK